VDVVAAHDHGARIHRLSAVFQAPPPAGLAVRRVLRQSAARGDAADLGGRFATGGIHLATTLQRPVLRRMRPL
jgi:hypothetical protein